MIIQSIVAAFFLMAIFINTSIAQRLPTPAEVQQEQQRIDQERKQLFNPQSLPNKAVLLNATKIGQEMRKIEAQRQAIFNVKNLATESSPNVFPDIATPACAGVNIETVAKQYEQKATTNKKSDLMIFASLTMPKASLKRLVHQAHQVGAAVVLRGFKNNSVKETLLAIKQLGEHNSHVIINPNTFSHYQIKAVPTVVLTTFTAIDQVNEQGALPTSRYVAVAGDVSLDYALEEIIHRSSLFEAAAGHYLRQMRGKE